MEPEKGPKGKRAKHIYKPPTFKRFHVKFRGMFPRLEKTLCNVTHRKHSHAVILMSHQKNIHHFIIYSLLMT